MSQLYMSGYSRKGDQMGLRDSGYNETRENIYNKQKDLHKEIEIDVPELEYGQEDYQVDESSNRESMNEINNKSDVSAHILQEYKMGQIYGSQKKAMTNSRMKSDYQSTPNGPRNDQRSSRSAERRVEELYKWQDRINKKHEVQREFQEQIKESMHDQKVFTNDFSNQIMDVKRPNTSVENILLMQGKVRELKIQKLEQELYGKDRVPNITKKGKNVNRGQDVHSRLYDLDKSRRDRSREALSVSRNQSKSIELQRSKSKDSIKRKSLYSLLRTSKQPSNNNDNNLDYFKDMFSPINKVGINTGRDFAISPQAILASSLTSFGSPVYSNRNADHNHFQRNFSMYESIDSRTSPRTQLSIAQNKRGLSQSRGSPISIYRKLTSFNPTPSNKQLAQNHAVGSEGNLEQNNKQVSSTSQEPSSHRYQSPDPAKRGFGNGQNQSESVPVLPNMLFFKSAERPVSVASNTVNPRDYSSTSKERSNRMFESTHQPFDMRSMEAFWEKILQDDVESRGRKDNHSLQYNEDYECSQYKFDFNERNKLWLDQKNKKLSDQRKRKEQEELKACTFKPHLSTQEKYSQKSNNQQLYQNFLQRVAQSSNATYDPYTNKVSGLTRSVQSTQKIGELDPLHVLRSGSNESPKNFGVPRSVKHSQEDIEIQQKLYDYILEAKYQ